MATSIRQFNIELYREHLEEASSLYDLRQAYLHDGEVNWPALKYWEDRFEAHIDALVLGGELALDVCRQRVADGDVGETHAALRVFSRQQRKDDALGTLMTLDPTDEDGFLGASRALRCEAPGAWQDDLLQLLQGDQPHLTRVLAPVAGFRRFPLEQALKTKLAGTPWAGHADVAWALGRVGSPESVPLLWPLLASDDGRVCEAAAVALMRLGDDRVVEHAILAAPQHPWARRVVAVGGNARSVRVLLDVLKGADADEETVIALGLLGDLAAVAPLLQLLSDDTLGGPAAVALNAITGAGLYTSRFVPDQFDPDELFDEEREAFDRDGTLPTRKGKPYGNWIRSALRDPARWQTWLENNRHRFSREHRWRMGVPYGPASLFACLKSETSPYSVRSATYDELVVRYGLDVPFEVELLVEQQSRFLKRIESWIATRSSAFSNGRWYFGGRLQG